MYSNGSGTLLSKTDSRHPLYSLPALPEPPRIPPGIGVTEDRFNPQKGMKNIENNMFGNVQESEFNISLDSYKMQLQSTRSLSSVVTQAAGKADPTLKNNTVTESLSKGIKAGIDASEYDKFKANAILNTDRSELLQFAAIQATHMGNTWKNFAVTGEYNRLDQMFSKITGKDIKSVQAILNNVRGQIYKDSENGGNLNYCIAKAATTVLYQSTASPNAIFIKVNADKLNNSTEEYKRMNPAGLESSTNLINNNKVYLKAKNTVTAQSIAENFTAGVFTGMYNGVKGTFQCLTNPIDTAKAVVFLSKATQPNSYESIMLKLAIAESCKRFGEELYVADGNKKANMCGKVVGEILIGLIGTKGAGAAMKALKAGKLTGTIDDVIRSAKSADKILDEAKVTSRLAEGTGKVVGRRSFRVLDEIADSVLVNKVKSIRSLLPSDLKKGGNLAVADVEIPGMKNQFYAHNEIDVLADARTSADKVSDISLKSTNPKLKFSKEYTSDGRLTDRDVDSEFKILNDLASKLGDNKNASGKIRLFTELEPCSSCRNAIDEFLGMYKNITIEVIHNNKTRLIP